MGSQCYSSYNILNSTKKTLPASETELFTLSTLNCYNDSDVVLAQVNYLSSNNSQMQLQNHQTIPHRQPAWCHQMLEDSRVTNGKEVVSRPEYGPGKYNLLENI